MNIVIMGGSFNPPHIAHVLMVSALHVYCPRARIWVAPTYVHAFSKSLMPFDLRLQMLKQTMGHIPNVTISTIERDLHDSTSYTIDVVREILRREPQTKIYITVGADIIGQLPQWRAYEELCRLARFMVFPREVTSVSILYKALPENFSVCLQTVMAVFAVGNHSSHRTIIPAIGISSRILCTI